MNENLYIAHKNLPHKTLRVHSARFWDLYVSGGLGETTAQGVCTNTICEFALKVDSGLGWGENPAVPGSLVCAWRFGTTLCPLSYTYV